MGSKPAEERSMQDVLNRVEAFVTLGKHYHAGGHASRASGYFRSALKECNELAAARAGYLAEVRATGDTRPPPPQPKLPWPQRLLVAARSAIFGDKTQNPKMLAASAGSGPTRSLGLLPTTAGSTSSLNEVPAVGSASTSSSSSPLGSTSASRDLIAVCSELATMPKGDEEKVLQVVEKITGRRPKGRKPENVRDSLLKWLEELPLNSMLAECHGYMGLSLLYSSNQLRHTLLEEQQMHPNEAKINKKETAVDNEHEQAGSSVLSVPKDATSTSASDSGLQGSRTLREAGAAKATEPALSSATHSEEAGVASKKFDKKKRLAEANIKNAAAGHIKVREAGVPDEARSATSKDGHPTLDESNIAALAINSSIWKERNEPYIFPGKRASKKEEDTTHEMDAANVSIENSAKTLGSTNTSPGLNKEEVDSRNQQAMLASTSHEKNENGVLQSSEAQRIEQGAEQEAAESCSSVSRLTATSTPSPTPTSASTTVEPPRASSRSEPVEPEVAATLVQTVEADAAKAEWHLRKALEHLHAMGNQAQKSELAEAYNNLGACLQQREKYQKAIDYYQIALERLLEYYENDDNNRFVCLTYYNLACCKWYASAGGREEIERAGLLCKRLFDADDPQRQAIETVAGLLESRLNTTSDLQKHFRDEEALEIGQQTEGDQKAQLDVSGSGGDRNVKMAISAGGGS
ncbi:unnamed protein product [Amoebophrya sp. A25]|nr:unnamed protein product [Amoebophrya sp. A25]|eukprot:GSA25T00011490001.1